MPTKILGPILKTCLGLYVVSTWGTMTGMEVFGWLTFILASTLLAFRGAQNSELLNLPTWQETADHIPWKSLLALLAITVIGIYLHPYTGEQRLFSIGSQRWILLFLILPFALAAFPPSLLGYRVFLGLISLVAIYAITQSFTGYDLVRPGSHRSVWPLDLEANFKLWRSAGFFGTPLQYGYNASIYVAVTLAAAVLSFKERQRWHWYFWGSTIAFVLLSLSVVTSFTRGAWIASAVSALVIIWLGNRKLLWLSLSTASAAFVALFFSLEIFRVRVLSLFNMQYQSNANRMQLWEANLLMFKDFPFFGIGYEMNEIRASEYLLKLGLPEGTFAGHAHSNYLQFLSGTGAAGFLAYLFIISFMLWLTWRVWKRIPSELIWPRTLILGALGAQVMIHLGGLTECNFKTGTTNHNLIVVWSLVVSISVLEAKGLLRKSYSTKFNGPAER